MPLAELLGHQRGGVVRRRGRAPGESTTAPGLMSPARLSVRKAAIVRQPLPLLVLGLADPDPRLQPALAGEDQPVFLVGLSAGLPRRPVQVDRQQLADRGAVVLAVGERVGAAEHEQAAAADAHEVPQERELVLGEEARPRCRRGSTAW